MKAKIDEEGESDAVRRGKHDIRLSVYSQAVLLNRSSSVLDSTQNVVYIVVGYILHTSV